jgi:K+/H+ antiporter YhaU regulatory subunit KhtT
MRLKNIKNIKIGKSDNKPEEDLVESEDTMVTEVNSIEEKINNKTKDLEETAQQLKGLSDSLTDSEENDDALPRPHGPLSELTVEQGNELLDRDANEDISNLLDETDEEITVVEVSSKDIAPAETEESNTEAVAQAAENEPEQKAEIDLKKEDDSDSFNNLFSNEEEEVNPLANLINSLPDVTAHELLDDLQEINEILRERRQS